MKTKSPIQKALKITFAALLLLLIAFFLYGMKSQSLEHHSVPQLITLLDAKPSGIGDSWQSLWQRTPEDLQTLLPNLTYYSPEQQRTRALEELKKRGPDAAQALPHFIPLLESNETAEKSRTLQAVGTLGPAAKEVIPLLIKQMDELPSFTLSQLLPDYTTALIRIQPESPEVLQAIHKTLNHETSATRSLALQALMNLEPYHGDALIPLLLQHIHHPDPSFRWQIINALADLNRPTHEVLQSLIAKVEDPDHGNRCIALKTLGHFGAASVPLLPQLGSYLESPPKSMSLEEANELKQSLIECLGNLGPQASPFLTPLWEAAETIDTPQKYTLALAHWKIQGPSTHLPDLYTRGFQVETPNQKVAMIQTLLTLNPLPSNLLNLLKIPLQDPEMKVRIAAIRALKTLGSQASSLVPDLQTLKQDSKKIVQTEAAEALEALLNPTPQEEKPQ